MPTGGGGFQGDIGKQYISVVPSLAGAGPIFAKAAEEHSKEYAKGFAKGAETELAREMQRVGETLSKAVSGGFKPTGRFLADQLIAMGRENQAAAAKAGAEVGAAYGNAMIAVMVKKAEEAQAAQRKFAEALANNPMLSTMSARAREASAVTKSALTEESALVKQNMGLWLQYRTHIRDAALEMERFHVGASTARRDTVFGAQGAAFDEQSGKYRESMAMLSAYQTRAGLTAASIETLRAAAAAKRAADHAAELKEVGTTETLYHNLYRGIQTEIDKTMERAVAAHAAMMGALSGKGLVPTGFGAAGLSDLRTKANQASIAAEWEANFGSDWKKRLEQAGEEGGKSLESGFAKWAPKLLSGLGLSAFIPLVQSAGKRAGNALKEAFAEETAKMGEEGLTPAFGDVMKNLTGKMGDFSKLAGMAMKGGLVTAGIAVADMMVKNLEHTFAFVNNEVKQFAKVGKDSADALMGAFSAAVEGKTPDIMGAFNVIEEGFKTIWQAPQNMLNLAIDNSVGHIPIIGSAVKSMAGEVESALNTIFPVFDELKGLAGQFLGTMFDIGDQWTEFARGIAGQTMDNEQMREYLGIVQEIGASGLVLHFRDVAQVVGELGQRLSGLDGGVGLTKDELKELAITVAEGQELLGNIKINIDDMTAAFNQFQVPASKVNGLMVEFINISRMTGTDINKIFHDVEAAGPSFSELGLSMEQVVFAMAKINQEFGSPAMQRTMLSLRGLPERFNKMGWGPEEGFKLFMPQLQAYVKQGLENPGAKDAFKSAIGYAAEFMSASAASTVVKIVANGLQNGVNYIGLPEQLQQQLEKAKNGPGKIGQELKDALETTKSWKDNLEIVSTELKSILAPLGAGLYQGLVHAGNHVVVWIKDNQDKIIHFAGEAMHWTLVGVSSVVRGIGDALRVSSGFIDTFVKSIVGVAEIIDLAMQAAIAPLTHISNRVWKFLGLGDHMQDALKDIRKDLVSATVPMNELRHSDIEGGADKLGDNFAKLSDIIDRQAIPSMKNLTDSGEAEARYNKHASSSSFLNVIADARGPRAGSPLEGLFPDAPESPDSDSGEAPMQADQLPPPGKAMGGAVGSDGWVRGGVSGKDSVPAYLPKGSYVIRETAARANAELLNSISSGGPGSGNLTPVMLMPGEKVMPPGGPMGLYDAVNYGRGYDEGGNVNDSFLTTMFKGFGRGVARALGVQIPKKPAPGDAGSVIMPGYSTGAGQYQSDSAAPTGGGVPLIQNPDGTWTSPNPDWAHLIKRESGGHAKIVQHGYVDANTGGNEAQGLFQITPQTWAGHGGLAFAPSPNQASPRQQGIIAARILKGDPSGSDWGAGRTGRENAAALMSGLGFAGGGEVPTCSFCGGGHIPGMCAGGSVGFAGGGWVEARDTPGGGPRNEYNESPVPGFWDFWNLPGQGVWNKIKKTLGFNAGGNVPGFAAGGSVGGNSVLQVIWDNSLTGQKVGEAGGKLVGPGTTQGGYYHSDWADHTGHVHTSFAANPFTGKFYGLKKGIDIRQGHAGFPRWVYQLGARYGLEASTYPGHQEGSGYNRGIDWWPKGHAEMSGASYKPEERARLQAFAENVAMLGTHFTGSGGLPGGAHWRSGFAGLLGHRRGGKRRPGGLPVGGGPDDFSGPNPAVPPPPDDGSGGDGEILGTLPLPAAPAPDGESSAGGHGGPGFGVERIPGHLVPYFKAWKARNQTAWNPFDNMPAIKKPQDYLHSFDDYLKGIKEAAVNQAKANQNQVKVDTEYNTQKDKVGRLWKDLQDEMGKNPPTHVPVTADNPEGLAWGTTVDAKARAYKTAKDQLDNMKDSVDDAQQSVDNMEDNAQIESEKESPKTSDDKYGKYGSMSEALGGGFVKGAAEELGFGELWKDVNGHMAKPPWEWGSWKLGGGVAGYISGFLKQNRQGTAGSIPGATLPDGTPAATDSTPVGPSSLPAPGATAGPALPAGSDEFVQAQAPSGSTMTVKRSYAAKNGWKVLGPAPQSAVPGGAATTSPAPTPAGAAPAPAAPVRQPLPAPENGGPRTPVEGQSPQNPYTWAVPRPAPGPSHSSLTDPQHTGGTAAPFGIQDFDPNSLYSDDSGADDYQKIASGKGGPAGGLNLWGLANAFLPRAVMHPTLTYSNSDMPGRMQGVGFKPGEAQPQSISHGPTYIFDQRGAWTPTAQNVKTVGEIGAKYPNTTPSAHPAAINTV